MKEEIRKIVESEDQQEVIRRLKELLQQNDKDEDLLLLLGESLYAGGKMSEALNQFNALLRLNPDCRKAQNYVTMINNILGYYCKDLLNP